MVNFGTAMEYVQKIRAFRTFGTDLFLFRVDNVSIDNLIFKLHSVVTVYILLIGTIFVTMKHFGEPIECLFNTPSDITKKMLEHYCWIESTYSMFNTHSSDIMSAYPGVRTSGHDNKVHHKYYQWIFFVLVIQAMMFYVPKYMWKSKEDRRISKLIADLKHKHIEHFGDHDRNRLLQDLADTLLCGFDYFRFFVFCEFFYIIHLAFQIWLTNILLGGYFYTLGFDWLNYVRSDDKLFDPLVSVFPRLTKCNFRKFGVSGEVMTYDALCFLPINIVNEKLYLILWFWFLILTVITVLYAFYHILLIFCRPFRYRRMKAIAPNTNRKDLRRLTSRVGNWFILQFVAANMKPSHFRDLIQLLMAEHYDMNGKPHYLQKPWLKAITVYNDQKSLVVHEKTDNNIKSEKKSRKKKYSDSKIDNSKSTAVDIYNGYEESKCDNTYNNDNNYNQSSVNWDQNEATDWPDSNESQPTQPPEPSAPAEQSTEPYGDENWDND